MPTHAHSGEYTPPIPYVVHGSFRKHLPGIHEAIRILDGTGVAKAIAPSGSIGQSEQDGFVIFAGEEEKNRYQIEAEYLQKVISLKALGGFSLFVAAGGYIGKSATYEYGIAQSCGVPTIFTEAPEDVPFYINPANVKSVGQLAEILATNPAEMLEPPRSTNAIDTAWNQLAFPTASVAVGGIVRYRDRIALAADGRWQDSRLTVPGTTVRPRETREDALQRGLSEKFSINPGDIGEVTPFQTSFMLENSGYLKLGVAPSSFVFDDRIIDLTREPKDNSQQIHFAHPSEVQDLLKSNDIEPNAASLLTTYFAKYEEWP